MNIPGIYTRLFLVLFLAGALVSVCSGTAKCADDSKRFTISSPAFGEGRMIPQQYTCDGKNISPPLNWSGAPKGTESFVLIADDPDAPAGIWIHWIMYNIPADVSGLAEDVPDTNTFDNGTRQGMTDFGTIGYGGPCPPGGTHRYQFKLYALDKKLDLDFGATKAQVTEAMKGHILGKAQLTGLYNRQ